MHSAAPDRAPTLSESDIVVCLEAIARTLHSEFQPRAFLADFSTALQPFVPHDRLGIGYLSDDGRTFSVFAEHGGPGFLPPTDRYTTDLGGAARFPVADSPLAPVADLPADPRFTDHAAELRSTGLKSAMFVPLLSGSRVVGKLSAATRVAALYGDAHVERPPRGRRPARAGSIPSGPGQLLEVLEVPQQLYPAQTTLSRIRADRLVAYVQLYKALDAEWTGEDAPTKRP